MQDREQEIAQAERLAQALRDLRVEQLLAEGTGLELATVVQLRLDVATLTRQLAARDETIKDLRRFHGRPGATSRRAGA